MQIDDYTFGRIDIGGRDYDADVITFPDRVQDHWWCQQGHRLARTDLGSVFADSPELLVIGTGYYGRMQVPEDTLAALRAEGIDVRVSDTRKAVAQFKRLQQECTHRCRATPHMLTGRHLVDPDSEDAYASYSSGASDASTSPRSRAFITRRSTASTAAITARSRSVPRRPASTRTASGSVASAAMLSPIAQ